MKAIEALWHSSNCSMTTHSVTTSTIIIKYGHDNSQTTAMSTSTVYGFSLPTSR